jgi:hypothetical protein
MWWVQAIGWVAVAAGGLLAAQSAARLAGVPWPMAARVGKRRARQTLYSGLVTIAVGLAAVSTGGQGALGLAAAVVVVTLTALTLRPRRG